MNRSHQSMRQKDDIEKCRRDLLQKLNRLELCLKKFRSTSPEKWADEIGLDIRDEFEVLSGTELKVFPPTQDVIKTIAENEEFIKQKVGGIEDVLCTFSNKFIPEGIQTLQEDVNILYEGTRGLEETIKYKGDNTTLELALDVQNGFKALYTGLRNIDEDVQIVIGNKCNQTSLDIQDKIIECIAYLEQIQDEERPGNIDKKTTADVAQEILTKIQEALKRVKKTLESVKANTSVLEDVQKELETAKEELKMNTKKMFDLSTQRENSSEHPELFTNLEEKDFLDLECQLGCEITDFILRREEDEISFIRDDYIQMFNKSK